MSELPQQNTIDQYVANGIATDYTVSFYTPLSAIDLGRPAIDVYVTPNGQQPIPENDIKLWQTDYTYSPNSDPTTGGTITFLTGRVPPLGATVTLSRDVPAELSVEFSEARTFNGQNLDDVLLQLLMMIQQNKTYNTQRNLSYRVNALLPSDDIESQTQLPVLGENQIWIGSAEGVSSETLEENPNVSVLRSQLANSSPNTDGARLVGYYDALTPAQTTVQAELASSKLFSTDTGSTNALVLTLANDIPAYSKGMEITVIPANTNTGSATINLNGLGAKNIVRNNTFNAQPGDIIAGQLLILIYDGSKFWIKNLNPMPSGTSVPFNGGTLQPGYLLEGSGNVSRTTYAALYAAIGTTWGSGDGSTTFGLPPTRRVLMGSGGTGDTRPGGVPGTTTGSLGGEAAHTPIIDETATHNHPPSEGNFLVDVGAGGNITVNPGGNAKNNGLTGNAGGGLAFNIMQPTRIVTMMIKI